MEINEDKIQEKELLPRTHICCRQWNNWYRSDLQSTYTIFTDVNWLGNSAHRPTHCIPGLQHRRRKVTDVLICVFGALK